jgi:preprotein translocase subunit SecG
VAPQFRDRQGAQGLGKIDAQVPQIIFGQRKDKGMTRSSILFAALFLGAGLALQAGADTSHKHDAKVEAKPAAPATALTEGEVRKVDKAAGKVTIKHGPARATETRRQDQIRCRRRRRRIHRHPPGEAEIGRLLRVSGKSA